MSFTSDLVLKNNAAANKTFTVVGGGNGSSRVVRLDTASTTALPRKMTIDHSVVNSASGKSDRHLVQVTAAESDGNGGTLTTVVNLTITIPQKCADHSQAKDAIAFIFDLLQDAGAANAAFDQLTRGES